MNATAKAATQTCQMHSTGIRKAKSWYEKAKDLLSAKL